MGKTLDQNARFTVSCGGGRWGRRRTRTTEVYAVIKAEDLYTSILQDAGARVAPELRGTSIYGFDFGRRFYEVHWEVRPNAVWRKGRPFFACPRCSRRCSRLYIPIAGSFMACRTCLGLTYGSRSLRTYRDSLWGRGALARLFGETQRDRALQATQEARWHRRQQCFERWAARRKYHA